MAPLIVLVGGYLLLRLLGLRVAGLDGWHPALHRALAMMFLLTASAHFAGARRAGLIAMVPPALPHPGRLVTLTGGLEVAGAVGLLVPGLHRLAAACLALLLLALFPANVHAARASLLLGGRPVTPLPTRTALQMLYVGACLAVALN